MTESAQRQEVPEVSEKDSQSAQPTEVSKEVSQSARPEQVREFDAKLLQVLPELSKAEMQHLIDHPEELRARLSTYGLNEIDYHCASTFLACYRDREFLDPWSEFYADEFQVDPDFSRVRLPDAKVYTYVTPIRVATKVCIENIAKVIQKHGVDIVDFKNGKFTNLKGDLWDPALNIARPRENYIASFSTKISETIPSSIRDERRYRGSCMTLREHLLWVAYCLYRRDAAHHFRRDIREFEPNLASFTGVFATCGSTFNGEMPVVNFGKDAFGADHMAVTSRFFGPVSFQSQIQVRRVKLFSALPQI